MNYVDFIIIGFVLIGFILGYKDGLVRKIIGLLGLFLGIFLAVKFAAKAGRLIAPLMDGEVYLAEIAAGILIFLAVLVLSAVVKRLVHPHDKVSKFVNQLLGGITGTVQIIFLISGIFLFLNIFNVPDKKASGKSMFYSSVYGIMPKTIDFMIGGKDFFKDYIENKDKAELKKNDKLESRRKDSAEPEITAAKDTLSQPEKNKKMKKTVIIKKNKNRQTTKIARN
ncbi:MAG TPA: CvpA family protein [Ignavibacteriales bacterium]|nr:CvpA family protein [Ignavibacteriales bacterium]